MIRRHAGTSAVCVVLLGAVFGVPVAAQEPDEVVGTDRPGVVVGADTLPRGLWQVESGVDYARESNAAGRTHRVSGVVTINFGLVNGAELLLEGEPIVFLRGDEHATGLGDTVVGIKLRLLEGEKSTVLPTFAVLPSVKVPTAPTPIGSGEVDTAVLALATWALGRCDVTVNAGAARLGQRDGHLVQAIAVAAVQPEITPRVRGLIEAFFNSRDADDGRDRLGLTVGGVWIVTPALALDLGVQSTVRGRGPEYVVRAGFSRRFGR